MRPVPLIALAWIAAGCGLVVDFGPEGPGSSDAGSGALDARAGDGRTAGDTGGPTDARDEETGRDASVDAGDSGVLFRSCKEILDAGMSRGDGDYVIMVGTVARPVYCDMANGGWTRVVHVSPGAGCIAGLALRSDDGVCAPPPPPEGCSNTGDPRMTGLYLPVPLDRYSEIRGTARGRQYGTTDAFAHGGTIDDPYVDGLSITVGSPRVHVWTYAAGLFDNEGIMDAQTCPCTAYGADAPAFVGTSYHCDSGNDYPFTLACEWHGPTLWGDEGTCGPYGDPWFQVDVGPRSDLLEVRAMFSQDDEDIGIELLELYAR